MALEYVTGYKIICDGCDEIYANCWDDRIFDFQDEAMANATRDGWAVDDNSKYPSARCPACKEVARVVDGLMSSNREKS